ncbi:DgyrCDS8771 [Dimorphilus gyrociliatus]|uniref:DgyrCDS8771 n=1 Tax=Dimorphilus gyrociliatus TaxID=2664684 RepID=A0A7I8VW74_9ANNE|nr:DgyrCDS8771 [Dimorphilus gyrociliatus]
MSALLRHSLFDSEFKKLLKEEFKEEYEKCTVDCDMHGKTVLVTDGCDVIGKECIKKFLYSGARVVMGCEVWDRGVEALDKIEKETGIINHLEIMELSFMSFKSVREFANQFNNNFGITSYCCHVGPIESNFHKNSLFYKKIMDMLGILSSKKKFKTAEQAAQVPLFCCLSPLIKSFSGRFFREFEVMTPPKLVENETSSKKFLEATKRLVGA